MDTNHDKNFDWTTRTFHQLSNTEVFEILKVRCEVFVVEQQCAYSDPDEKDLVALHLTGRCDGEISAYARLLPPGISYPEASIGRVLTIKKFRRLGLGKTLMHLAIEQCFHFFASNSIHISAQQYLLPFYNQLGFKAIGTPYLEDNIPHCGMILEKSH